MSVTKRVQELVRIVHTQAELRIHRSLARNTRGVRGGKDNKNMKTPGSR